MKTPSFNLQQIAAAMIIIALVLCFLTFAQNLLKPIFFAIIISIMLRPLCNWYDRYLPWNGLSVFLTLITVVTPIAFLGYVFFTQFQGILSELPSITAQVEEGLLALDRLIQNRLPIPIDENSGLLNSGIGGLLSTIQSGLMTSTSFLASFILFILYTFFILLYRKSFKSFIVHQFRSSLQDSARVVFRKIQKMNERYLYGMLIVMVVLGVLNSLGLYIIDIKHPFFWGFLGGMLAIIPYIGTFIGGLLPFAYAFATTDNLWQPISVAIFYIVVQQLEGNMITPKIVGSSVKLNPLAAILALIIGAWFWGISGAILAIPLLAIIRIVFSHIDVLKPYSLLLSSNLYGNEQMFAEKFDDDRYRLFTPKKSKLSK